jgi:DNA-binding GntR family transcriptional regulator
MIADGQLAPGDRISHRVLAKHFGVSDTPVREAIGQLVHDGLVESRPRRGTFIAAMSPRRVAEMFELRELIECSAVEKLSGKISHEALSELREMNAQLGKLLQEAKRTERRLWASQEARHWLRYDSGIHFTILCEAGSLLTIKTVQDMQLFSHAFGYLDQRPTFESLEVAVRSHAGLFDAMQRGDAKAATEIMAEHTRNSCKGILTAIEHGHWGQIKNWQGAEKELLPSVIQRLKSLGINQGG